MAAYTNSGKTKPQEEAEDEREAPHLAEKISTTDKYWKGKGRLGSLEGTWRSVCAAHMALGWF